ncbi:MAG: NAD-dependent malic enzyme [Oligoflexales bacterium]|nr:NAD-dependent malic enzyme [Oligoflexales bacterium]
MTSERKKNQQVKSVTDLHSEYEELSLTYHEEKPHGKISVVCHKPLKTQKDLSLAYSPGVAGPCRRIHANSEDSFRYTGRGNLVGIITNGTAVLGLGAIGPYAAKPVMEGKAMLFKKFAGIDAFDIEVDATNPELFVQIVKSLEPTFGGINLEDIKGPDCFYIERVLKESLSIPVFHDDQHGTAIVAGAGLINACEVTGRSIDKAKVVFSGAGAAAIGCAWLFKLLGVSKENLILCDTQGVIHSEREDLNSFKQEFALKTSLRTLEEALEGADVFVGVSVAGSLTPRMLKKMAKDPIVFALANPDPEILPEDAKKARPDVIIATGRSDYPNQINNVLCFPYLFRGALDVRAYGINDQMKIAAAHALANLAKKKIPARVRAVYGLSDKAGFGRDYLIPKAVDPRVLSELAPAVAEAAMKTGQARIHLSLEEYRKSLKSR